MRHPSARSKRQNLIKPWVIGGFALVALILGLVYIFRGNPLVSHSSHTLDAALDGDADRLYDLMHPEERKALELDREGWRRVFNEGIKPLLSPYRALGGREYSTDQGGVEWGSAVQTLVDQNGKRSGLSFSTFATEAGPMTNIASRLVGFANREPVQDKLSGRNGADYLAALLPRKRAMFQELQALGLKGVFVGEKRRLVTWDEIIRDDEATIQRMRERATPKPPRPVKK